MSTRCAAVVEHRRARTAASTLRRSRDRLVQRGAQFRAQVGPHQRSRSRDGSPPATWRKRPARSDRCTTWWSSVAMSDGGAYSLEQALVQLARQKSVRRPPGLAPARVSGGTGRGGKLGGERRWPARHRAALVDVRCLVDDREQLARRRPAFPTAPRNRKPPGRSAKWNVSITRSCTAAIRGRSGGCGRRSRSRCENGGSLDDVVRREQHELAQLAAHPVATGLAGEEAPQALLGEIGDVESRVEGLSRARRSPARRDRWRTPASAGCSRAPLGLLGEQHRDRIGLLAGRARPAPRRAPVVAALVLEESRQTFAAQARRTPAGRGRNW